MARQGETERRNKRRVHLELPLRFVVLKNAGEPDPPLHSFTSTLSVNGLSFCTALSIPLHTRLRMMLTIPGVSDEVEVDGAIVRAIASEEERTDYEYGVRFDLPPEGQVLAQLVRSVDVAPLLEAMEQRNAQDLYLVPDAKPLWRVHGELEEALPRTLTPEAVAILVQGTMSSPQRRQFKRTRQLEYAFTIPGHSRWRINAHFQSGSPAATIRRLIPFVPDAEELGLPPVIQRLALSSHGLVLVTGPAQSGKSATLATMIGMINRETSRVVITIEDPLEYIHTNDRSLVKQREVGVDVDSIRHGLSNAASQRPDVIVASDLSDPESMDAALRAADGGCLVLGAINTSDPIAAIQRIAGMYPVEQRPAALYLISSALIGVVSQRLLPARTPTGTALALEIFTLTDDIRQAIRYDRFEHLATLALSGPGAQSIDVSLRSLVNRGHIAMETALRLAREPDRLRNAIDRNL